jgi:Phasin protein
MPTIEEEKPAKPRQRSRKAEQRNPKGERKAAARPDSDAISPVAAPVEAAPVEAAPMEAAPLAIAVESAPEVALSGEVLPPETRGSLPRAAGLPAIAIAQACDDYTRKSWLTGRILVERMSTVRSFDQAIEIQGEFAKQACANFLAHSEKIFVLYGEWAQQFFRPLDKFASRIGH